MRTRSRETFVLFLALLCFGQLTGCRAGNTVIVKDKEEVEILPDKWLNMEREFEVYKSDLEAMKNPPKDPHQLTLYDLAKQFAGYSGGGRYIEELDEKFILDWNGKRVAWKGKEIIITLREYEGTLYMVGFNREVSQKSRLVFFRLNKKGTGFDKIPPGDFPRQIATQNVALDFGKGGRYVRVGEDMIDTWPVIRKLDIDNVYFSLSLTAAMWYQLETGKEYYTKSNSDLTQQFLHDYVAKYKPIALPTIIKEPIAQTTNAVSNVTPNK